MSRPKIRADLQFYSQKSEAKQFSGDDELLGAVQMSWIIPKHNRMNLNWWCILAVLKWLKLFYRYMLPRKNMKKNTNIDHTYSCVHANQAFEFQEDFISPQWNMADSGPATWLRVGRQHGWEWAAKGNHFVINRTHLAFWIHVYIFEISTTK